MGWGWWQWGAGELAEFVGNVGGGDVEGGGRLAGVVFGMGGALLPAPTRAAGGRAVHPTFPRVIPLLGERLQFQLSFLFVIVQIILTVLSWVLAFVHGDRLNILVVPAPHVPPRVGHLGHLSAAGPRLCAPPADSKPLRVLTLPSDDLRQNPPPRVDEPVAHLQHGETGLLCQSQLFGVARVGVVPMLVQPLLQDLYRVLRKVASPAPGGRPPAGALLRGRVLVRAWAWVPLSFVDCREDWFNWGGDQKGGWLMVWLGKTK